MPEDFTQSWITVPPLTGPDVPNERGGAEVSLAANGIERVRANPMPDEFGRFRVRDEDTGHERSIHAEELPHGNYTVLSEPATDLAGDALPAKVAVPSSAVEPTTTGQSADTKEKSDG